MLHEPAAQGGNDPAASYKKKLGVKMFFIYAAVYVGFVAINLIDATLMEQEVLLGMNLAVVYGTGLIIFALIQALVYNYLCGKEEARLEPGDSTKSSNEKKGK